jgi:chitinase
MTTINQKLLVGYFPSAVIHGQRYQVADIPGDKLTHVIYAYVGVSSSNQCESINPQDDQLNFAALQLLKQNYRGLQILVSIGGPSNSGNYSDTASTAAKRKTFAQSCISFMKQSGFDGIDIDWEFPAAQDKLNYTALLNELRNELDTQGATDNKHYLLTAAISGKVDLYSNVDLTQIQQSLDWINLMTYNFYDSSNTITEFCAPLYLSSTDPQPDQLKRTWYNVTAIQRKYITILE